MQAEVQINFDHSYCGSMSCNGCIADLFSQFFSNIFIVLLNTIFYDKLK